MSKKRNLKIFMGLNEIAGIFTRLSDAFDILGIENRFVDSIGHKFNYEKTISRPNEFFSRKFQKWRRLYHESNNKIIKQFSKVMFGFLLIILFVYSAIKFNAFIFIYENYFFSHLPIRINKLKYLDLIILKILHKKIIFLYVGNDSRPIYVGIPKHSFDYDFEQIVRETKEQKERIEYIEKYADYIIDCNSNSAFRSKKFINFQAIGIPCIAEDRGKNIEGKSLKSKVKIMHAPSDLAGKGTKTIREVIKEIISEGYNIEYIECVNKSNREVKEILKECDLIIDQLYSDTPMAGFASEAASFGIPAVVGGYYSKCFDKMNPGIPKAPSCYCLPDELKEAVIELIINKEERLKLGDGAWNFVSTNWNYLEVAKRYCSLFHDEIPDYWWYDPYDSEYIFGAGMDATVIRRLITEIVSRYGWEALCIEDKPKLKEKYHELISFKA